jgi:hypothetical protein
MADKVHIPTEALNGCRRASGLAQLKRRWIDHRATQTPRLACDMIVAVLSDTGLAAQSPGSG